jgi:hypothetical protein
MLPNIYADILEFNPDVSENDTIPIARALTEISAIAASPFVLLFSRILSSKKATSNIIGIAVCNGGIPMATAIERIPNPTCDNPSPIIE